MAAEGGTLVLVGIDMLDEVDQQLLLWTADRSEPWPRGDKTVFDTRIVATASQYFEGQDRPVLGAFGERHVIPPRLEFRREDILSRLAQLLERPSLPMTAELAERLLTYDWTDTEFQSTAINLRRVLQRTGVLTSTAFKPPKRPKPRRQR